MRKVRIEHELVNTACLAKIIDSETGEIIENVISLDLNLSAGEPAIRGILSWYALCKNCGGFADHGKSKEFLTESEEVEILYVDKFDQAQVGVAF